MSADDIHVCPIADRYKHVTAGTECPCNPEIRLEGSQLIVIHNAFDFREIAEELAEESA